MHRRAFLRSTVGAPAFLSGASRHPNIVLLLADDLGYGDLSCYGSPDISTPRIDSLSRSGVRFTQCYANGPECSPTRSALLTGRYQQRVGGMECAIGIGNVGRYDEAVWLQKRGELGLPVEETSIAAMLKPLGYDTACIGKWHLGYEPKFSPNRHRFDHFFGIMGGSADYFRHVEPGGQPTLYENGKPVSRSGYLTDLLAEESVAWLRRRSSTPFFLYVPFNAPHDPMQGPDDRAKPLTAETWNRGDRATYVKMVERMDAAVGEILEQLRKMGAVENTLVAFLSDNGGQRLARNLPLRGGKSSVYEGGLRVPGIVRWPGVAPEGATSRQVAITMDLAPTFLKSAGGSDPRPLDGVDLTAWIKVPSTSVPRTLFWRYKRGTTVRKAVRDGDLKLTNDDGREELFDLSKDPEEKNNLLAARPESAQRLKSKLSEWEERVRAPRLRPFEQRAARSETR